MENLSKFRFNTLTKVILVNSVMPGLTFFIYIFFKATTKRTVYELNDNPTP